MCQTYLSCGLVSTTITLSTSSTGTYITGWIPIGNYIVQVSKSGFITQSKNITVPTGGIATVRFTLQ